MNESQHHAVYRWFEYTAEQRRREYERRHAAAAVWGALTALGCLGGLLYLFG